MEKCLYDLPKATPLAQDIALGRNPETLCKYEFTETYITNIPYIYSSTADNMGNVCCLATENSELVRELLQRELPTMTQPNSDQQRALQSALVKPFTLIQGPPGTGKTMTGARLAVLYVLMNKMAPPPPPADSKAKDKPPPQILYCGPSNKSVDVVAG